MVHQVSFTLTLPLAVGILARLATAMPSSLLPRTDLSKQSSCLDLENYQAEQGIQLQSDMWGKSDASGFLSDWWNGHYGDSNFASDFAAPWGIGQSFSCQLSVPCVRPSCSNLESPEQPSAGPAYEVMVSLSNINQFLATLRTSFLFSHDRWTGLQVAMQEKFWPNPPNDLLTLKEILITLSAVLGMGVGVASGFVDTIPKAIGSTTTAMMGGLVTAATQAIGSGSDLSLQYLASMEVATDTWYQGALNTINNLNDDLMSIGHHTFPDGSISDIQPLLTDGVWLDYRNIPVLNTDASRPRVTSSDLNQLTYNLLLGQLINFSWKQQATWIVKYDMSQEDFDNFVAVSGSNDGRLKLYYGGSAFFFQGLYMNGYIPNSQNPPGWGDIEGEFSGACTPADILRSSADSWHASGFGHTWDLKDLPTDDPQSLLALGPKSPGFWNIPICVPPADAVTDLNSLNDFLDPPGEWFADGGPYGSNWCLCLGTTDANGVTFASQFPESWLEAMDPSCNPSNPPAPGY